MSLEDDPVYQWHRTMKGLRAELAAMTAFDRGQVALLVSTTTHSWQSAMQAVTRKDFRVLPTAQPVMPDKVASLNLPPPKAAKGRRLTKRQRRAQGR